MVYNFILDRLRTLIRTLTPNSLGLLFRRIKELKKANPRLPILIRECSGTDPQPWARYGACVIPLRHYNIYLHF
ncbi:putative ribosomal protein/NADH dehydrogenase [Helianthus anomalus]